MTGDSLNDAPVLRQAAVGVAVSAASDVASAMLTTDGLVSIVALVTSGRATYPPVLTWVLNRISRTILEARFVVIAFPVRVAVVHWLMTLLEGLGMLAFAWHRFGLVNHDGRWQTFTFELFLYFAVWFPISVHVRRAFWRLQPSLAISWSGIAELAPRPMVDSSSRYSKPALDAESPKAKWIVSYVLGDDLDKSRYYDVHSIEQMSHPLTMLADDTNSKPLTYGHRAPLRLRNGVQLGFEQVTRIAGIELVAEFSAIGGGQGGCNPDHEFFGNVSVDLSLYLTMCAYAPLPVFVENSMLRSRSRAESMQGSTFVHRQMVGLLALDQVLRFLGRGSDRVAIELDMRRNLLANDTSASTCLRIPMHSLSNLEYRHRSRSCIACAVPVEKRYDLWSDCKSAR